MGKDFSYKIIDNNDCNSSYFEELKRVNFAKNSWDGPSGDIMYSKTEMIEELKKYIDTCMEDTQSWHFETTLRVFGKIISEMSDDNSIIIYYD